MRAAFFLSEYQSNHHHAKNNKVFHFYEQQYKLCEHINNVALIFFLTKHRTPLITRNNGKSKFALSYLID